MLGKLDQFEIDALLHNQILGRIGCHANDVTYIVPISYAYDGECIYAITHEGLKIDIMRQNNQVCFEAEQIPNMAAWQTVICWGEFEELTEMPDRHRALELLSKRKLPNMSSQTTKLSPTWPFQTGDIDSIKGVVFRIRLIRKTGRFEKHETESIYAWD